MSNRAITWALHQSIPPTEKWVLAVLCNAANDKENLTCRRSLSLLAKETSFNRRTIMDAVTNLIANQRIEKVGTHKDGSTIYRVLVVQHHQDQWYSTTSRSNKKAEPVLQHHQGGGTAPHVPVVQHPRAGGTAPHITKEPTKPNEPGKGNRTRKNAGATPTPSAFPITFPMRNWITDTFTTMHSDLISTLGIDVEAETEKFLDYHRSKGSRFVDWNAAWKNWMRKAVDFKQGGRNGKNFETSAERNDRISRESGESLVRRVTAAQNGNGIRRCDDRTADGDLCAEAIDIQHNRD